MRTRNCKRRRMAYGVGGGFTQSEQNSRVVAPGLLKSAPSLLGDVRNSAEGINNMSMPANIDPTALWNVQSNRLLNSMRPGEAARGMLTSGQSQNVENQGLSNMASQFTTDQFNRAMQQFQASLGQKTAYSSVLSDALKTILNQGTQYTGSSSGMNLNYGVPTAGK